MDFTHLHTHSHYSLLDGLAKIDQLIARAKECKMKSLALTDHGVMYGAIEFYQKATAAGIKPIIGVEAYLAPNGYQNKQERQKPYHLVLLAKNQQGYQNLLKLTTLAHLEGFYYKPRIDKQLLKKYHQGLIASSACLQGEIPQAIIKGNMKQATALAKEYQEIFGPDNFYLEVQYHPNLAEQQIANKGILKISQQTNIPVIATNDIHYVYPEDNETQDILLCLQTKKRQSDQDRLKMNDDFSFRTTEEMATAFYQHPEVISNTQKIVKQCTLKIELDKIKLPYFPLPSDKTADEYLAELARQGLTKKYPNITPEIKKRFNYELSIFKKTGFASYFLIVYDFVNWAKQKRIMVGPGRGSAPSSLIVYCLGITNVDPLKYNLIFERFLNPERISMPDIDLDFADTRRDEVIQYVENKYGKDHVAQIITFGTMAARAATRDVGRVLSFPYTFCDQLAKMIPLGFNLNKALNNNLELKTLYQTNADARKIIDIAKKLEGVVRHSSRHACGILITPEPLIKYVPLRYETNGQEKTIISQYSKKPIEDLGLLKMDFLGLKNLTILETAIKIISRTKKQSIDLNKIPLDDQKTYSLLKSAQTVGVFQLESEGMRKYLKQLEPACLEDIAAMISLYRPGPMSLIPEYISNRQGKTQPHYLHPDLKPILEKTHGIAIYQEQLLEIVRELAGFSYSEADVLRKAIGKKIISLLKKQRSKFIQGCIKNKISTTTAEEIFSFIEPFAGYGFNKSHGTCYALIAYQTAYLKANYPIEFIAALLTSDCHDTDRIAIEIEEAKRLKIKILPPDVNESLEQFTVVDNQTIRFGLSAIKNIGNNLITNIIQERKDNGNYKNLTNFLKRLPNKDLNKKSLESLIKCGALDNFYPRRQMFFNLRQLILFHHEQQQERRNGQHSLFSLMSEPIKQLTLLSIDKQQSLPKNIEAIWEKDLLGLYLSRHPFQDMAIKLKELITPCQQLPQIYIGSPVKIGGVISKIKKIITYSKQIMYFVKIEDLTGSIEIIVFPNLLNQTPDLWQENKLVLVQGRLSNKDDALKIIAGQAEEIIDK